MAPPFHHNDRIAGVAGLKAPLHVALDEKDLNTFIAKRAYKSIMLQAHVLGGRNCVTLPIPALIYIAESTDILNAFGRIDPVQLLTWPVHQYCTHLTNVIVAAPSPAPNAFQFILGFKCRLRLSAEHFHRHIVDVICVLIFSHRGNSFGI